MGITDLFHIYKYVFGNKKASDNNMSKAFVGATGFEPAAAWSQTRSATGLRYTPNNSRENALSCICGCKGTTFSRDMQIFLQLFYNILILEYFFEHLHSSFHLFFGMCGHKCKAHQGILWSTCRRYHRVDEHAGVEGSCRNYKCLLDVSYV